MNKKYGNGTSDPSAIPARVLTKDEVKEAREEKKLNKKYGNGTSDPSAIPASKNQDSKTARVRSTDRDELDKAKSRRRHASREESPDLSQAEIYR